MINCIICIISPTSNMCPCETIMSICILHWSWIYWSKNMNEISKIFSSRTLVCIKFNKLNIRGVLLSLWYPFPHLTTQVVIILMILCILCPHMYLKWENIFHKMWIELFAILGYNVSSKIDEQLKPPGDPFTNIVKYLIPAWISYYIYYKIWDEITYSFPKLQH